MNVDLVCRIKLLGFTLDTEAMSIGIPENPVMALMMAAFIIKGIQPGPNMISGHPDLFWGLVASMWVGNVFLVVLNVPLVRYWLSVFKIPYNVLFPAILFFCCIGTFSVNSNLDDILTTAAFGLLGYVFMRLDLDAAPLMLGFILGPMQEEYFRRALLLSRGSFSTFVSRRSIMASRPPIFSSRPTIVASRPKTLFSKPTILAAMPSTISFSGASAAARV